MVLRPRSLVWASRLLSLLCCCLFLISCATVEKYPFEKIGVCNVQVQSGQFDDITKLYEEASAQRDRNSALWDNQLGSIYMARGDYRDALDAFLRAHYLMNDIPAFKELERKAVALTGSEDAKAYKGDPYEKAMNSLYVGLLLYHDGDLENAMAAFKNGILADSDSTQETYKSDIAILYLLASRTAKKTGDKSLSDDYLNAVRELASHENYLQLGFNDALIEKMLDLRNNVLLVIEYGEGPTKSRTGTYGEMAVINGYGDKMEGWKVKVDGKEENGDPVYSDTDVYFQASTRGGRKMDGILKGKAQFKTDTAQTALAMANLSQQYAQQAQQARRTNPYADTSGYTMASGLAALIAGGSALASAVTNPKADIRCWNLLPEHILVFPLALSLGKHAVEVEFLASKDRVNFRFEVDIQNDRDVVVFKRILRYQVAAQAAARAG